VDLLPGALAHPAYTHIEGDIREVTAAVPDLHVLVNNAGTLAEEDALSVNLMGTMAFTERHLSSPSLKSVLFVASASARNGAEFPRYVASKAGLVGYMKNLALTLAKRGVVCNSISPGGVITPMNRHILEDERLYAAVKAETLLGKWCEPEEIADLAWYLTAINRSITGEDILIDNGEMLKSNFIW
jgi:NAD(P)-dependent dehydrogenase (short-subunit alcohol dehydrogenase family)